MIVHVDNILFAVALIAGALIMLIAWWMSKRFGRWGKWIFLVFTILVLVTVAIGVSIL